MVQEVINGQQNRQMFSAHVAKGALQRILTAYDRDETLFTNLPIETIESNFTTVSA